MKLLSPLQDAASCSDVPAAKYCNLFLNLKEKWNENKTRPPGIDIASESL